MLQHTISYSFTKFVFHNNFSENIKKFNHSIEELVFSTLKEAKKLNTKNSPEIYLGFTTQGVECCGASDLITIFSDNLNSLYSSQIISDQEDTILYDKKISGEQLNQQIIKDFKESDFKSDLKKYSLSISRSVGIDVKDLSGKLSLIR